MPSVRLFKKASSNLFKIELFLEFVNTSAGVNEFLFTGKERVALGTNFNSDVLLRGKNLDDITAVAGNGGLFAYGMDAFLHDFHLFRNVIGRYST